MIKQIDEIPQSLQEKRESYRQMIRADIEEAIAKGIDRWEFEGEYNYTYLAQYAREEADRIWRKIAWDIRKPIAKYWKEQGLRYASCNPSYKQKGQYIKIKQHKADDRMHVYGEIDKVFLANYPKMVEEEFAKDLENQIENDKKRAERIKKLGKTIGEQKG